MTIDLRAGEKRPIRSVRSIVPCRHDSVGAGWMVRFSLTAAPATWHAPSVIESIDGVRANLRGSLRDQPRDRVARLFAGVVVLAAIALTAWIRRPTFATIAMASGEGSLPVRLFEVMRASIARGDGVAYWDRFQCGGGPYWANADAPLIAPLLTGLARVPGDLAVRALSTAVMVAAMVGAYAWARRNLELDRLASMTTAALWIASGSFGTRALARPVFWAVALLPTLLVLARAAAKSKRATAAAAIVFAWMVVDGGVTATPIAIVALFASELPRLLRRGDRADAMKSLAAPIATGLALAAFKLVPVLRERALQPSGFVEHEHYELAHLAPMLLDAEPPPSMAQGYAIDDYWAYAGPTALGMAIAGLGAAMILRRHRRALGVLAIALFSSLALAMGATTPKSPFVMLSHLPLFDAFHAPSRWLALTTLAVAGLAGVAVNAAIDHARGHRLVQLAIVGLALYAVRDPATASRAAIERAWKGHALPRPAPPPSAYHLGNEADLDKLAALPARNVGTTH
ncbi:MAG: hypothetical protein ACHREM_26495, partial [Polyangiales bacterium]